MRERGEYAKIVTLVELFAGICSRTMLMYDAKTSNTDRLLCFMPNPMKPYCRCKFVFPCEACVSRALVSRSAALVNLTIRAPPMLSKLKFNDEAAK